MGQLDINYYTKVYDNFLDDEICDAFVSSFEETLRVDGEEVKNTSICTGPNIHFSTDAF